MKDRVREQNETEQNRTKQNKTEQNRSGFANFRHAEDFGPKGRKSSSLKVEPTLDEKRKQKGFAKFTFALGVYTASNDDPTFES